MPRKPDPTAYYRLTNAYTGPNAPLSVYRDPTTSHIYLTTASSSQNDAPITTPYWQFLPILQSSPARYQILTEFTDPADASRHFLALDVCGNDKTKPHLTKPGNYSGQYWCLESWSDDGQDDGMDNVKLTNDFSGRLLHLDTYADTKQGFLGDGDHSGQHWVIERVDKPGLSTVRSLSSFQQRRREMRTQRVGLLAFGIGFGAAVVVGLAWVEILPLMLVGGLSLGVGVLLGRG